MQFDAHGPIYDWPSEHQWRPDRRPLWLVGGALLAVFAVVVVVAVAVAAGRAVGSSLAVGTSDKADIEDVTESMLISGAPPVIQGASWRTETRTDPGDGSAINLQPAECGLLTLGFPSERRVTGSYTGRGGTRLDIALENTAEQPDLDEIVTRCFRYTYGGRSTGSLESVSLQGLPTWATVAVDVDNGTWAALVIGGFYRGLYIRAVYSEPDQALRPDRLVALVAMFNQQVDRLDEV